MKFQNDTKNVPNKFFNRKTINSKSDGETEHIILSIDLTFM